MEKRLRNEIAGALISLTGSLKLYPPQHPAVKTPVARFLDAVRPYLFEKNHIFIRLYEGLVVVEGEPTYDLAGQSEEVFEVFANKKLEGFEIHRGVGEKDLIEFLSLLITDKTADGYEFKRLAQSRGIKRITPVPVESEEDMVKKAHRIYKEAKKLIVDIIQDGRRGILNREVGEKATEMMGELNDIMDKDVNAVLPLVILQDYDEYTFNHCVNVGILSLALARSMGFTSDKIVPTGVGGMLHDIGKTKIPKNILMKTSKLTSEEWELIKAHPVFGAQMAREMAGIEDYALKVIYQHHVGADLKGYPKLKTPSELVKGALIVATADNYDAMTTQRTYQRRMEPKEALNIMARKVGTYLDREIFETFLELLGKYPLGSVVRLNTAEVGIVSRLNLNDRDHPYVKIIMDSQGNKLEKPFEVNTAEVDPASGKRIREIVGTADPLTRGLIDITHYFSID